MARNYLLLLLTILPAIINGQEIQCRDSDLANKVSLNGFAQTDILQLFLIVHGCGENQVQLNSIGCLFNSASCTIAEAKKTKFPEDVCFVHVWISKEKKEITPDLQDAVNIWTDGVQFVTDRVYNCSIQSDRVVTELKRLINPDADFKMEF